MLLGSLITCIPEFDCVFVRLCFHLGVRHHAVVLAPVTNAYRYDIVALSGPVESFCHLDLVATAERTRQKLVLVKDRIDACHTNDVL